MDGNDIGEALLRARPGGPNGYTAHRSNAVAGSAQDPIQRTTLIPSSTPTAPAKAG